MVVDEAVYPGVTLVKLPLTVPVEVMVMTLKVWPLVGAQLSIVFTGAN